MAAPTIHPQLLADCHHLGTLTHCELLLNRNAGLHWFILVPHSGVQDVLDLEALERNAIFDECAAVSAFIKQVLGYRKVNVAGLGNVVPDMHLHVIGRAEDDPAWPQPVWGNLPEGGEYDLAQLEALQAGLERMTGMAPAHL